MPRNFQSLPAIPARLEYGVSLEQGADFINELLDQAEDLWALGQVSTPDFRAWCARLDAYSETWLG